ncbi:long-chain fatty acid--CoA ligase [Caldichromatium japonicum]|uniref:Long-chain fatty acid--CoA ligase n=1 Tax=Caldichromatium japonicum TaxID=2699430 RepID=A0A6G7VEE0_9GAMM|nr:long-chain fatty acid--CoA ligase [Caldichromatium japonicum]QIK38255.1 long-chain fatty acid--CoA ligase [Caldichromatium japonicum]
MSPNAHDPIPASVARTLAGLFAERIRRSPERLAYRHFVRGLGWQDLSWQAMGEQAARWRQALASEGLQVGDRVAVLLRNCPEWVLFDQATLSLGLVTVPLYTDDRAENVAYILQDSGVKVLLIQDAGRWRRLAEALDSPADLRRAVILESSPAAEELAAHDPRVRVAAGWLPENPPPFEVLDLDPQALATIVYTSGTTGRPKGVMLSHHNILSNVAAALTLFQVGPDDLFLSFLPLSHMLERTAGYYLPMMASAAVSYARSVNQLAEDLQALQPTVLIAVPRIFDRLHQRIAEQLAARPVLIRWPFALAVESGWREFLYRQGRAGWHPLLLIAPWLRPRFGRSILKRLGGRLRVAVSGGAPLPPAVARIFIALGLPILQGYGLTETSPVISVNPIDDNIPESVGRPLPGIELRIGDNDELLVRGPNVMQGYWNNPEATARVLEADGWLHTGDQARIQDGHLYITGRLKEILVLSNGEKVPPADLEMAIGADPLFDQVMVLGEGRSYLAAILVLNAEQWPPFARAHGLDPDQPASLHDPQIHKAIIRRIRDLLSDFPGYAKVRRVILSLEPWSVENGLLTSTMKVRRNRVIDYHAAAVAALYQGEEPTLVLQAMRDSG